MSPALKSVKALNWNGLDGNEVLMITYLDPHFMFSVLFSDAFDDLSQKELKELLSLPAVVLEDLQTIVAYTFESNLAHDLTDPQPVFYDMLGVNDEDEEDE
ncbi:MAG: hypothetical protein QNJ78_09870 [Gammaproteobacteria bacterium]|nr:hypothetical protein [Gammaproteobacteria bacterium]